MTVEELYNLPIKMEAFRHRPRLVLQSVVAVADAHSEFPDATERRVLVSSEPSSKRDRRLFAVALSGTLERFKKEEAGNAALLERRRLLLTRAEEKGQERSTLLREQERKQKGEKRRADATQEIEQRAERSLKAVAEALAPLSAFLFTGALPSLAWLPAKQCAATENELKRCSEKRLMKLANIDSVELDAMETDGCQPDAAKDDAAAVDVAE